MLSNRQIQPEIGLYRVIRQCSQTRLLNSDRPRPKEPEGIQGRVHLGPYELFLCILWQKNCIGIFSLIQRPAVILALAQEGVDRRKDMFKHLDSDALVLQADGVEVPVCNARIHPMDLKSRGIKKPDWALASLGVLAGFGKIISRETLAAALKIRFKGKTLDTALELV